MKPCFISNSLCDETHALITISGHQKKKLEVVQINKVAILLKVE